MKRLLALISLAAVRNVRTVIKGGKVVVNKRSERRIRLRKGFGETSPEREARRRVRRP